MGTGDKPPTVEENVGRLEVKMREMELKMELQEKDKDTHEKKLMETLDLFKSEVADIKDGLSLCPYGERKPILQDCV